MTLYGDKYTQSLKTGGEPAIPGAGRINLKLRPAHGLYRFSRSERTPPRSSRQMDAPACPFDSLLAGINREDISTPSSSSSFIFVAIPPAYPVRLPFPPTTRWHGMIMEMGLCPTAPPTACPDMVGLFNITAIRFAISP